MEDIDELKFINYRFFDCFYQFLFFKFIIALAVNAKTDLVFIAITSRKCYRRYRYKYLLIIL